MVLFRFFLVVFLVSGMLNVPYGVCGDFVEEEGEFEIFEEDDVEEDVAEEDTKVLNQEQNLEKEEEVSGSFIPEGEIDTKGGNNIIRNRDNLPVVKSMELFNKLKYGRKVKNSEIEGWLYNVSDVNECLDNGKTMLLQMVANSSDIDAMDLLIGYGAELETNCQPKYNALFVAAQNNISSKVIDFLINKGADIVVKDYEGNTALLIASSSNPSVDVIGVLVEYGLKVDAQNNLGFTPLMLAVHQNSIEVVKELLKNGADVNIKDKKGRTALMAAAVRGDDDIMQLLISYGADYNVVDINKMSVLDYYNKNKYLKDKEYKESKYLSPSEKLELQYTYITDNHYKYNKALRESIWDGDAVAKVKEAIDRKADINSLDDNGCTPLFNAARNRKPVEVFELLLKAGAMVNAVCVEDLSALMMVSTLAQGRDNSNEAIKKLRLMNDYNLNINAVDKGGNTALMYALNSGADVNYVVSLLTLGADVNVVNNNGDTPLGIAVKRNAPMKVLEVLIEYGANLDFKDAGGETVLWYLLKNNKDVERIILLLESGADTSIVNKIGKTPLWHLLLNNENQELLNAFIKYDKNLNTPNTSGDTPLLFAVKNDYPTEVIKTMLFYGANPEIKDRNGKNAMDVLRESKFFDATIKEQTRKKVLSGW
ncbi:MAG: ankyrin repeat domain-containing protein [Alphaproteobacteria bacterium]|nr:ankyrin repeat domain-containing protein [Alphaproteobacteria bacterium]